MSTTINAENAEFAEILFRCACSASPALNVEDTSHLLFGSDIPRGETGRFTADLLAELPRTGVAPADVPRIHPGNAEALFPRLKRQS